MFFSKLLCKRFLLASCCCWSFLFKSSVVKAAVWEVPVLKLFPVKLLAEKLSVCKLLLESCWCRSCSVRSASLQAVPGKLLRQSALKLLRQGASKLFSVKVSCSSWVFWSCLAEVLVGKLVAKVFLSKFLSASCSGRSSLRRRFCCEAALAPLCWTKLLLKSCWSKLALEKPVLRSCSLQVPSSVWVRLLSASCFLSRLFSPSCSEATFRKAKAAKKKFWKTRLSIKLLLAKVVASSLLKVFSGKLGCSKLSCWRLFLASLFFWICLWSVERLFWSCFSESWLPKFSGKKLFQAAVGKILFWKVLLWEAELVWLNCCWPSCCFKTWSWQGFLWKLSAGFWIWILLAKLWRMKLEKFSVWKLFFLKLIWLKLVVLVLV